MKKLVEGSFNIVNERDIILGNTFKEYTIETNNILALSKIEEIRLLDKTKYKRLIVFTNNLMMTISANSPQELLFSDWDL